MSVTYIVRYMFLIDVRVVITTDGLTVIIYDEYYDININTFVLLLVLT